MHRQDEQPLAGSALPLHVQELIVPQDLIDPLCRDYKPGDRSCEGKKPPKNGNTAGKRIGHYCHSDNWVNRMIVGDSLLVMHALAVREDMGGKVQTIYFDPPYGIDFGYNWQVSTRNGLAGRSSEVSQPSEQVRGYRDTWAEGVPSYLAHLRQRLMLTRGLLHESGSILVQIGDENVHRVRCLLDEVFGSENFIATIAFKKKKMPLRETYIFTHCDYVLWYGKDARRTKFHKLFLPRQERDYGYVELPDGHVLSRSRSAARGKLPRGARLFQSMDLRSSGRTESCVFSFQFGGRRFFPSAGRSWKTNRDGMNKLRLAGRLFAPGHTLRYKLFFKDYPVQELSHMWMDTQGATGKTYVVQTPAKVVERCLLMTTDPGDLVLDPTGGSGTTAYVAEQWGRRWITIDTSRLALSLARTRLLTAQFPWYRVAALSASCPAQVDVDNGFMSSAAGADDPRHGFLYRRVPHITLRSIAHNPDIHENMSRAEIEAAIARQAADEVLYDQPQEDRRIVRLCGTFRVESLWAHRASIGPNDPATIQTANGTRPPQNYLKMILNNLGLAGVQNTVKKQRLNFDRLGPHPGQWIHAHGAWTEAGQTRRVAIAVGAAHATIGPDFIASAAREAFGQAAFDLLVVCAFAFDPRAAREAQRHRARMVLMACINPELAMSEHLAGPGNLFMVFGEPVINILKQPEGKVVVEIQGIKMPDSSSDPPHLRPPEDVACWFIDTNYNGKSFRICQAYYCGPAQPYQKLKRALGTRIEESAWPTFCSSRSRAFQPPSRGKIAVKLINHYGEEVLQEFAVNGKLAIKTVEQVT
jgi:adenine-specific DNA-methyltransferase